MWDVPTHLQLYPRHGIEVIPGRENKAPAIKDWQRKASCDPDTLRYWFLERRYPVLGIPTGERNGIVAVDVDSIPMLWKLQERYGFLIRTLVRTPRGAHAYFRWPGHRVPNAVKVRKGDMEYDLRGDGGFVIAPPSIVDTHQSRGRYRFMKDYLFRGLDWLVPLPDEFMPPDRKADQVSRVPARPRIAAASLEYARVLRRAEAWLALREPAVSGANGHTKMFATAVALWRMGVAPDDLWRLLCKYNERCSPPFKLEPDLRHKWEDAMKPYPR